MYVTDGATLAAILEAEIPRYLPHTQLTLGHVRNRPLIGEINLTHLSVRQPIDGISLQVAKIPWLKVRHDPRAMLKGKFAFREVVVAQPTLRLKRRQDGTWNIQGLLADPWPGPVLETPPIVIQNGTLVLVESDNDARTDSGGVAILRDVTLKIESGGPHKLQFEGTAKGDALDRLNVQGTVDISSGRVEFKGDIRRLVFSETLRSRLPGRVAAPGPEDGAERRRGRHPDRPGGLRSHGHAAPALRSLGDAPRGIARVLASCPFPSTMSPPRWRSATASSRSSAPWATTARPRSA